MNERRSRCHGVRTQGIRMEGIRSVKLASYSLAVLAIVMALESGACSGDKRALAGEGATVGVTKVVRKSLGRQITLSSELVPFQEIDVYAKESGYVKKLDVDYGARAKAGQVISILEIPQLEEQLQEDQAEIKNATNQVSRADNELKRDDAQYQALHLQYTRLKSVSETQPGIVAQQEVDDAQGKDLAAASQSDAGKASLEATQSQLSVARARLAHDQALFDYAKITAPFAGVITERYANLGTLVQAGTGSSTQAMPIVRVSQEDLFRLVIPVPESYVQYIRVGDHVDVRVPSLNRSFPGKVARFSVDVRSDTRTMHTEVDVPNPQRVLVPGLYADAELELDQTANVPTVPVQAVSHAEGKTSVMVVNSDGVLEHRLVQVGMETSTDAQIVSGLNEGEQVVVSDRGGLKAGQEVRAQLVSMMEYHENNAQ